jgi:hypothetical protein
MADLLVIAFFAAAIAAGLGLLRLADALRPTEESR